jgi:hypothetical protein
MGCDRSRVDLDPGAARGQFGNCDRNDLAVAILRFFCLFEDDCYFRNKHKSCTGSFFFLMISRWETFVGDDGAGLQAATLAVTLSN